MLNDVKKKIGRKEMGGGINDINYQSVNNNNIKMKTRTNKMWKNC